MSFKSFLHILIHFSGINYLCSFFLKKRVFVLMYHSINNGNENLDIPLEIYKHISINRSDFERQIEYLRENGHTFIGFNELLSCDLNKLIKPTIIYFDDGFKDFLLNAKPILDKYNIPSTVFLVSGILDRTNMLWTLLLRKSLIEDGLSKIEQDKIIEGLKFKTDKERVSYMKKYNIDKNDKLFDLFLSGNDVKKMSEMGQNFGSHTVTHPRLSECSVDSLQYEILESKRYIENLIGVKINSFSLPYGRVNIDLLDKFKENGYRFLVSKGIGLNDVSDLDKDLIFLKNISPKSAESFITFKVKMYFLNLFR